MFRDIKDRETAFHLPGGLGTDSMDKRENDRRPTWMLVTAMLIFGTIGLIRRYIPLPSALIAFIRGIIGGLVILPFSLRKGRGKVRMSRRDMLLLVTAGILIGFNWVLLFEAYNYTTVAVATLCYYMQPTIVTLLSPAVLGEKLTLRKTLCAAVAVAGMVLVSGVTDSSGAGVDIRGVIFGLGAAVLYAAVILINKSSVEGDVYRRTATELISAGLVLIPYLILTDGFRMEGAGPAAVILLIVAGTVHTGAAYLLYFGSLNGLSAQSAAILSYIDPVSALLFSALFLREPLSSAGMIGAVMIIGSAVFSEI